MQFVTKQSTSSTFKISTQGEVDTQGATASHPIGNIPHHDCQIHAEVGREMTPWAGDDTPPFDCLVGHMHKCTRWRSQLPCPPTVQLHMLPNLLEYPDYIVSIPMVSTKKLTMQPPLRCIKWHACPNRAPCQSRS